jgi:sulfotransferase family protein
MSPSAFWKDIQEIGRRGGSWVSVIHKLAYSVKHMLALDKSGHNFVTYPDDTFIVSFPKSGNTWTRFLIANLLQLDPPVTFLDMERLVPSIDGQTRRFFKAMPRPRVLKDHAAFTPQYKNVIYIVRDPRDVALSAHNFLLKGTIIDESYPFMTFVSEFVKGVRSPVGSWGENVASWLATRGNSPRFLLLRYEDMLSATTRELERIASFLGMPVTTEHLVEAARRSSADNMRKLEKMHGDEWSQNRHMKRKDIPFVRSAKAGGWRSTLPKDAVTAIESAWGPIMTRLGYELSGSADSGEEQVAHSCT